MAKIIIPTNSLDLIEQLLLRFPDKIEVDEDKTSPFARGKRAGVVELLRELKQNIKERL